MKLEGYDKAADEFKLNEHVIKYFEEKEKELGREIIISYGGYSIQPEPVQKLFKRKQPIVIFDWARPQGKNALTSVDNRSGLALPGTEGSIKFPILGQKCHSAENDSYPKVAFVTSNQCYAQIYKDIIWSLFPIANYGSAECWNQAGVFKPVDETLHRVFDRLLDQAANWEDWEERKKQQHQNELVDRIKAGLNQALKQEKTELENKIVTDQQSINGYLEMAGAKAKAVRDGQLKLERIVDQEKYLDEEAEKQLRELSNHKLLDSYDVDAGYQLIMYTKPLWLYNTAKTRRGKLGRMKITVNLKTNGIQIANIDSKSPAGLHHPHINTTICWGNIDTLVYRMLTKADFAGMFNAIMKFLETYQSDHYGYDAGWWLDTRINPKAEVESFDKDKKKWIPETKEQNRVNSDAARAYRRVY